MIFITVFVIALGLSMDCFAVTIGAGISGKRNSFSQNLYIAFIFGLFHFIMPLSGWLIGDVFKEHIKSFDHYIAFSLLIFIGCKMIYEALKSNKKESFAFHNNFFIFGLALATSIDALIVGLSLALIDFNLLLSISIISLTAFIISFSGFYIGRRFSCYCGSKAELIGGLMLVAIGVKIFVEHIIKGI
ncbi:MAG: manganese efflux pump MntP family protein [Bacteroidales bacterium]|nr:manganese efflux pump MntP family protein [Bacteroidales bacterium]